MKRLYVFLTAAAACGCLLAFQACKKEDNAADVLPSQGSNTSFTKASDLLKSWAPAVQTFTIDATAGGTVTGSKGTMLIIKPGSVKSLSGVVSGNVTVSLTEIRTKKDMMSLGVFTGASDGNILESGGMFKVSIRKGSEQLFIDPANPMTVKVPDPVGNFDQQMLLFAGNDTAATDSFKWVRQNGNKVMPDSAKSEYYVFEWWNMGYCNVDKYVDMNNCSNNFSATIPSSYDALKTSIMIVFSDYHAEASTYYDNGLSSYQTPYCLPLGKNIKVICVTIKDKKLYYSITNTTVSSTTSVTIPEGTLISESDLAALIEGL